MPSEDIWIGTLAERFGHVDRLAVEGIVVPAVLELLPDPATDFEAQVGRDGHIPGIE